MVYPSSRGREAAACPGAEPGLALNGHSLPLSSPDMVSAPSAVASPCPSGNPGVDHVALGPLTQLEERPWWRVYFTIPHTWVGRSSKVLIPLGLGATRGPSWNAELAQVQQGSSFRPENWCPGKTRTIVH